VIRILIAAGIGGTLPTLCRLAAAYSVNPDQAAPAIGSYIAVGLFFVIGMAVAFGFDESQLRKAFALGIAGPAIVTSIFSGASQTHGTVTGNVNRSTLEQISSVFGIADAHADVRALHLAQTVSAGMNASDRSQLIVVPSLIGSGVMPQGMSIGLTFLTSTGEVLALTPVSPSLKSTVNVPVGATAVRAAIGGAVTTVQLPPMAFQSAQLSLNMATSPSNDFLWALGSTRHSEIRTLSAAISNVSSVPNVTVSPPIVGPVAATPVAPSVDEAALCSTGKVKERVVTALMVGSDTVYIYILKQRILHPQYADAYFFATKPWPDEAITPEQFHHRIRALAPSDYLAKHIQNGQSVSLPLGKIVERFTLKQMHQSRSFAEVKICST
jgi:hypothetical protein